jgi:uncharacterized membrane protein YhaH (DUF805 family)
VSLSVPQQPGLFSPYGTRSRPSFAVITVGLFIVSVALGIAMAYAGKDDAAVAIAVLAGLVAVNWVSVCVYAQRSRDAGYNPWIAVVSIVPIGAFVLWLILMTQPSRG